jgi:hypothetical protein
MNTKQIYIPIFSLIFIFSFTGCYTLKPSGTLSSPDYNQRVSVTNANFKKKNNILGISLNIGGATAGGILGYSSNLIKQQTETGQNPNYIANTAIGAFGGYAISYLINQLCGLNKVIPVQDPNDWIKKVNSHYVLMDGYGTNFEIINSKVEKDYFVHNFNDVLEFKNVFPRSEYTEKMLGRTLNVLPKSDIPRLLDIYPNSSLTNKFELEYLSHCNTINDCIEAGNRFSGIKDQADLKASKMVDSWEKFEKYNSGFSSSRNMNDVVCSIIDGANNYNSKNKAAFFEKIKSKNFKNISCLSLVTTGLDLLYNVDLEKYNVEQLNNYISDFPLSPYLVKAQSRLNDLIKVDYIMALAENKISSMQGFVNKFQYFNSADEYVDYCRAEIKKIQNQREVEIENERIQQRKDAFSNAKIGDRLCFTQNWSRTEEGLWLIIKLTSDKKINYTMNIIAFIEQINGDNFMIRIAQISSSNKNEYSTPDIKGLKYREGDIVWINPFLGENKDWYFCN